MSAALSRDSWRALEPFLGADVPNREVILLDDVKSLLEKASDCAPSTGDNSITVELLAALQGLLHRANPAYVECGVLQGKLIVARDVAHAAVAKATSDVPTKQGETA